jgi:hypothetical protein
MNDERKMGLHPIPNDPRRGVRSERRTQSDLLTQQRLVDIMRPTQGSPYGPNLTQSLPDGGGEAPIAGLGFGEVGDEYIVDTPKQEYRYPAKNYGVSDVEYDGRQKDLITGGEMSNAQQPPFDTLPDRDFGRRFLDRSFGSIPKWRHNNFALDIDKTRHPQAWRAMDWQLQQMMHAPGKGNLPMGGDGFNMGTVHPGILDPWSEAGMERLARNSGNYPKYSQQFKDALSLDDAGNFDQEKWNALMKNRDWKHPVDTSGLGREREKEIGFDPTNHAAYREYMYGTVPPNPPPTEEVDESDPFYKPNRKEPWTSPYHSGGFRYKLSDPEDQ